MSYLSLGTIVVATSSGAGLAGGLASRYLLQAMSRAPSSRAALMRAFIIGAALIETGAILGIVVALMLLSSFPSGSQLINNYLLVHTGMACALGITGFVVALASCYVLQNALYALSRQPLFSNKIIRLMLLSQTIIQTPLIFSFLVSLIMYSQLNSTLTLLGGVKCLAAGLSIGLGSIGPLIGLMNFARAAMKALARNRDAYGKIVPFSFISQAIIETPIIFALLIAIIMLLVPLKNLEGSKGIIIYIVTGLLMGLGTLGAGISSGKTAQAACEQLAIAPAHSSLIARTSVVAQGIIDAVAIYVFLIALMLLLLS